MTISQAGIDAIKRREGFVDHAYPDAGGYSIGYGHFGAKEGDTCTEEQAAAWLAEDVKDRVGSLNAHINADLGQDQFDALCSWAYNVGREAAEKSTLLELINMGLKEYAGYQLFMWIKSQGKVNRNLLSRRDDEFAQWNGTGRCAIRNDIPTEGPSQAS